MTSFHRLFRKRSDVFLVYGILILFIMIASLLQPRFLSFMNLENLFITSLPLLIAAYAQSIALYSGGVDLSLGSLISLVTTVCATKMITAEPWGFLPGILLALLAGLAVGLVNGVIVTKFRLQPLIVTLCTSLIVSGLALFFLDKPGGKIHSGFARFMNAPLFSLFLFLGITAVLWTLLNHTKIGKAIYAVGGNEGSAYAAGIHPAKTKMIAFAMVSTLAAIAGIVLSCQIYSGDPIAGGPFTLRTMTAAVIGGASFAGGKGNVLCTIAGVFILSIINNILNLVGLSAFYQFIAQGIILIFAIAVTSRRA